jgi:transglutaminase-like putative cysteine protease
MKKIGKHGISFIAGVAVGAVVFGAAGAFAASVIANPTTSKVFVDGAEVGVEAYNINDSNYFKLRDIAVAVGFAVEWDGANDRILIDTTNPYTPESVAPPKPTATSDADVPGLSAGQVGEVTAVDYSQAANPAIFAAPPGRERVSTWNADGTFDKWLTYEEYERQRYNEQRQKVLDTGEIATEWGRYAPTSTAAIEAANQFIESLVALSELEKVNRISNFLCKHLDYNADVEFNGNDFWTDIAYGVCEQYAQTMRYMCYRAGLPCLYVSGERTPARQTGLHAWNEVYVDGKWQFYDGTISDSRGRIVLAETADAAGTGYTYIYPKSNSTMFYKEIYAPGSTL